MLKSGVSFTRIIYIYNVIMYCKYHRSELSSTVNLTALPRVWSGKLTGGGTAHAAPTCLSLFRNLFI